MEKIIDSAVFTELTASVGDDFIGELVDTYLDETPRLIADLQQALAQGEADTFRRMAHSIKSSSATFGANVFAAQARELEMMGKAGDLSAAGPKVSQLASDYRQVEQALQELKHGA